MGKVTNAIKSLSPGRSATTSRSPGRSATTSKSDAQQNKLLYLFADESKKYAFDASIRENLFRCMDDLDKQQAVQHKGMYRVPGTETNVRAYLNEFILKGDESKVGKLNPDDRFDVLARAGALKRYLVAMKGNEWQRIFAEILSSETDCQLDVSTIREKLNKVPYLARGVLKRALQHLKNLTEAEKVNKMTVHNTVLCFGMVLWGTPVTLQLANDKNHQAKQDRLLQFLINNRDELICERQFTADAQGCQLEVKLADQVMKCLAWIESKALGVKHIYSASGKVTDVDNCEKWYITEGSKSVSEAEIRLAHAIGSAVKRFLSKRPVEMWKQTFDTIIKTTAADADLTPWNYNVADKLNALPDLIRSLLQRLLRNLKRVAECKGSNMNANSLARCFLGVFFNTEQTADQNKSLENKRILLLEMLIGDEGGVLSDTSLENLEDCDLCLKRIENEGQRAAEAYLDGRPLHKEAHKFFYGYFKGADKKNYSPASAKAVDVGKAVRIYLKMADKSVLTAEFVRRADRILPKDGILKSTEELKETLKELPETNYRALHRLMEHLSIVSNKNAEEIKRLALLFTPALCPKIQIGQFDQTSGSASQEAALAQTQQVKDQIGKAASIVAVLIEQHSTVFA